MMLVSLAAASARLRRDSSDDDADVTLMIQAASEMVYNYLGAQVESVILCDSDGVPVEDSDGVAEDVPAVVESATLYLVGWLYRNRDQNTDNAFDPGYLPAPVTAMLYPLRDPVIA